MNRALREIRRLPRRLFGRRGEPSRAIFRRIRWRLTLWYSGVLAISLLLFALLLYAGERNALLGPVDNQLRASAQGIAVQCWNGPPFPHPLEGMQRSQFWACYDTHGTLFNAGDLARFAPHFVDSSILAAARQDHIANDVIDGGADFGSIRRYAVSVTDPGGHFLGTVVVGQEVGPQVDALDKLVQLLPLLGVLTLLVASGGGLLLANRALLPARLAYARQRNFVADAAHELRTPLTILRADAEVLLRGRERYSADDAALLEDVVAEASHMTALANSMLDLARLDSDGAHLEQEVVDLSALAAEIARRVTALAMEREVTVRVESEEPALIIGDRLLLEQAVLVLVDNAIKYNRPGGEVILRAGTGDERAFLEVRDTGIGIAPEHLPRLGERFYRVDKARSRAAGGAGLGVSIAQRIATRHGGSLRLVSQPEQGTAATLILPRARKSQNIAP